MAMRDSDLIIVTDFGPVRLSPRVTAYMDSLDENWWEVINNKRKRGRHAKWLRGKFADIESAAMILSEIKWASGEKLDEL